MPIRDDFGIIRARLLTDPRTHEAADLYVKAGLALPATALAAVVGHVVQLSIFAIRDADDGLLRGDGIPALCAALFCDRTTAAGFRCALSTAGLLRETQEGTYIVGFSDTYKGLLERRRRDAERRSQARNAARPQDIRKTSARHPRRVCDVSAGTVSVAVAANPPSPLPGGRIEPAARDETPAEPGVVEKSDPGPRPDPRPLRPRDRERYRRVLDYVAACGDLQAQTLARERRREGPVPDSTLRDRLEREYAWVTSDRLARHRKAP